MPKTTFKDEEEKCLLTQNDLDQELDLPLSSNFDEVKVRHFILDMECYLKKKTFESSIILFCQLTPSSADTDTTTNISLDVHSLDISSCHLFDLSINESESLTKSFLAYESAVLKVPSYNVEIFESIHQSFMKEERKKVNLNYEVKTHFVNINLPQIFKDKSQQVCVIEVVYTTQATGASVIWTADQSGRFDFFY